jgi:hypothetical protein
MPPIFRDIHQLASHLPDKISRLPARMRGIPWLYRISVEFWPKHECDIAGSAVKVVPTVAGMVVAFFSFLVMTSYFILDGERAPGLDHFDDGARCRRPFALHHAARP